MSNKEDEEENDPTVCDVCLDGEVYEENDIIYCDNCDVAVHQLCYGVENVPEGSWFCYVCSSKLNPSETSCELCPYVGGAYKHTEKSGKWVHGLCACWIPEVFEVYPTANDVFVNLSKLDAKRYKLKCTICSKKGACVQCAYGRCTTSVHPWCALKDSHGFTRRIVKDGGGNTIWEIFCSVHAKAVSDPVKIKVKSKNPIRDLDDELNDSYWVDPVSSSVNTKASTHNATVAQQVRSVLPERDSTQLPAKSFPIVSLLEWPGISEGDAMDLDHFWNYISSFYPEDHNAEWLEFMIGCIGLQYNQQDGLKLLLEGSNLANSDEMEEKLDTLLSNYLSEKDRQSIFSPVRRAALLKEVQDILLQLKGNHQTSFGSDDLNLEEVDFLFKNDVLDMRNRLGTVLASELFLQVIFNGLERFDCELVIDKRVDFGGKELAGNDWSFQYLYPHNNSDKQILKSDYMAKLCSFSKLGRFDQSILSNGATLIPKIEEDELSRIIFCESKALTALNEELYEKLVSMSTHNGLLSLSSKNLELNESAKEVGMHYLHQQIWRKICFSLHNGLRDHSLESLPNEDDVPPSWKIAASGRPVPENDDELEPHEDAVCMCCFDGTSSENNRIIFCDGCNCTVHQLCYGVPEIPEGDYFCDRCRYIQLLSHDSVDELDEIAIKTAVQCCLCPLHHGGLKPTTDGRWAHLYCLMLAKNSRIDDLREISAVDVSKVVISTKINKFDGVVCKFCKQYDGYLIQCDFFETGDDSKELCCSTMFHPICAWFAGMYFSTEIVDPSFCGSVAYPSGIRFRIFCECHSSMFRNDRELIKYQSTLRSNFKINEKDLGLFPGHNKRRRYKGRKKQQSLPSRQTKTLKSSPKELPIDVYTNMCCICLHSTERNLFNDCHNLRCDISVNSFLIRDVDGNLLSNNHTEVESPYSSQSENIARIVTCRKCSIAVHAKCFSGIHEKYNFELHEYECFVCRSTDHANVSCCLCPRKGGFLVETADGKWAHLFCATNSPLLTKWQSSGELDLKTIPKECKKQKCCVCNRKSGVCVQCASAGCTTFFHSLCGMKSGLAFARVRGNSREFYCKNHIPSGLAAISSAYWIDGHELHRLRYCFDRARLVLDLIIKREKLKKLIFKTETDSAENKFERMLHRVKGKRLSVSEFELEDSELSESEVDSLDGLNTTSNNENFVSLENVVSTGSLKVKLFNNHEVDISSLWSNDCGVKLPKLIATICGIEVSKADIAKETSERNFLSNLCKLIEAAVDQTRNSTKIFPSKSEEQSFSYSIEQHLAKFLSFSNKEFLNVATNHETLQNIMSLQELEHLQPKRKRKYSEQDTANLESPPSKKTSKCDIVQEYDDIMNSHVSENQKLFIDQMEKRRIADCVNHLMQKVHDKVLDEWKVYSHAELYKLERLLQDFLTYLASLSSNGCFKNLKRFSSTDSLTKDFDVIPYEVIPNYNKFVRRIVCLNDIKGKLHRHEYNCLGAFSHDFFLMLNNARSVTDSSSQTWQDTKILAESFEQAIMKLEQDPLCKQPRSNPSDFEVTRGFQSTNSNSLKIVCGNCATKYTARGWPANFHYNKSLSVSKQKHGTNARIKSDEVVSDSSYTWICPVCTVDLGINLIGSRIKVWWIDDSCSYSGEIDAFDEFSKCHRVLYDDSEWEFINLSVEPFVIKFNKY